MLSSIGRATHEAREHSPSLHEHSKALRTESLGKGVSLVAVAVAVGKFTVKLLPRPKINGSLVLCSHMALGFAKAGSWTALQIAQSKTTAELLIPPALELKQHTRTRTHIYTGLTQLSTHNTRRLFTSP